MVEFYHGKPGEDKEPYVLLYHHADMYPSFAIPDITRRLKHAMQYVSDPPCAWWDPERVAGMFVAWSLGDYEKPSLDPGEAYRVQFEIERAAKEGREPKLNGTGYGVPVYQPALHYFGDIEFLYRVYLYREGAGGHFSLNKPKFTIHCFAPAGDWWNDAPEVPAPDDRLKRIEVTATGLYKVCPYCGVKLTSKNRKTHEC